MARLVLGPGTSHAPPSMSPDARHLDAEHDAARPELAFATLCARTARRMQHEAKPGVQRARYDAMQQTIEQQAALLAAVQNFPPPFAAQGEPRCLPRRSTPA